MLSEGFPFWTKIFGNIVGWLFNDCVINLHPRITLGSFIVTFLLNSDFFPAPGSFGSYSSKRNNKSDNSNYEPKHASTRETRYYYKNRGD